MRPVSAEFLRTLRGSHRMVADARVVPPGTTGTNPAGAPLTILAGDVYMDATAEIRATLVLEVADDGKWPYRAADPLAPYGHEIMIRRGIAYGGGRTEWVSLGYYRIDTIEQTGRPGSPIRISGSDRMANIVDGRLPAPIQFAATDTYGTVVTRLVTEVYPGAVIEWDDTTNGRLLGRALVAEEDRYGFLHDLVTAAGKVWSWDHRGHLVIETAPDPAVPVWDVDHGAGGVLVDLARTLTREGVYNGVVAVGEAGDTERPVRGMAVDSSPSSPTRWGGPFGKVPRFYSSPFLTDDGQARDAAAAILRRGLGLPYTVDLRAVPNPALVPYDPIHVRYPGHAETHVLETLTIPLVADQAMQATTREQTTVLLGVQ